MFISFSTQKRVKNRQLVKSSRRLEEHYARATKIRADRRLSLTSNRLPPLFVNFSARIWFHCAGRCFNCHPPSPTCRRDQPTANLNDAARVWRRNHQPTKDTFDRRFKHAVTTFLTFLTPKLHHRLQDRIRRQLTPIREPHDIPTPRRIRKDGHCSPRKGPGLCGRGDVVLLHLASPEADITTKTQGQRDHQVIRTRSKPRPYANPVSDTPWHRALTLLSNSNGRARRHFSSRIRGICTRSRGHRPNQCHPTCPRTK